ncbi:MAG: M48 family metalloprotease [bacterium]
MKKNYLLILLISLLLSIPVYAHSPRVREHQLEEEISTDDIIAEIKFGRDVAARIIGKYGIYKDDELTKYLNLLGRSLASGANRPELNFVVGILDTTTINAFAAPGGYIFITKGVIDTVDNEAQLAAVIAHEIIHIAQRHIVKELNIRASESSSTSGLSRLLSGTSETTRIAFSKAIDETVTILFERGYKKNDEIEADTMGVMLASSTGYNPTALVTFIEKIKQLKDQDTSNYKSLYPPFDERIKHIKDTIDEEGLAKGEYITKKERLIAYRKNDE